MHYKNKYNKIEYMHRYKDVSVCMYIERMTIVKYLKLFFYLLQ